MFSNFYNKILGKCDANKKLVKLEITVNKDLFHTGFLFVCLFEGTVERN